MRKIMSLFVLIAFIFTSIAPPAGFAQTLQGVGLLPAPGTMVSVSAAFTPAHLTGVIIDAKDPLKFDFLIHKGDAALTADQKGDEYKKLIKYFLAALTIPDTDQWVNLSPYEGDRIIKDDFGMTEMGRDLLAQDYILKQLTASLIHPDTDLGRKFWERVYEKVHQTYGAVDVPMNAFNKVWITPDKAVVWEKDNAAYILESRLKVLTEQDYVSLQKNSNSTVFATDSADSAQVSDLAKLSGDIVREIIIPEIEKEVNEGKNFANLRQIYSGMLLATWYKKALKESFLGKIYADRAKVLGVEQDPKNNEVIYQQYLAAFKTGVFNMIKEDTDKYSQEVIPRKYFSGGWLGNDKAMIIVAKPAAGQAGVLAGDLADDELERVPTRLADANGQKRAPPRVEKAVAQSVKEGIVGREFPNTAMAEAELQLSSLIRERLRAAGNVENIEAMARVVRRQVALGATEDGKGFVVVDRAQTDDGETEVEYRKDELSPQEQKARVIQGLARQLNINKLPGASDSEVQRRMGFARIDVEKSLRDQYWIADTAGKKTVRGLALINIMQAVLNNFDQLNVIAQEGGDVDSVRRRMDSYLKDVVESRVPDLSKGEIYDEIARALLPDPAQGKTQTVAVSASEFEEINKRRVVKHATESQFIFYEGGINKSRGGMIHRYFSSSGRSVSFTISEDENQSNGRTHLRYQDYTGENPDLVVEVDGAYAIDPQFGSDAFDPPSEKRQTVSTATALKLISYAQDKARRKGLTPFGLRQALAAKNDLKGRGIFAGDQDSIYAAFNKTPKFLFARHKFYVGGIIGPNRVDDFSIITATDGKERKVILTLKTHAMQKVQDAVHSKILEISFAENQRYSFDDDPDFLYAIVNYVLGRDSGISLDIEQELSNQEKQVQAVAMLQERFGDKAFKAVDAKVQFSKMSLPQIIAWQRNNLNDLEVTIVLNDGGEDPKALMQADTKLLADLEKLRLVDVKDGRTPKEKKAIAIAMLKAHFGDKVVATVDKQQKFSNMSLAEIIDWQKGRLQNLETAIILNDGGEDINALMQKDRELLSQLESISDRAQASVEELRVLSGKLSDKAPVLPSGFTTFRAFLGPEDNFKGGFTKAGWDVLPEKELLVRGVASAEVNNMSQVVLIPDTLVTSDIKEAYGDTGLDLFNAVGREVPTEVQGKPTRQIPAGTNLILVAQVPTPQGVQAWYVPELFMSAYEDLLLFQQVTLATSDQIQKKLMPKGSWASLTKLRRLSLALHNVKSVVPAADYTAAADKLIRVSQSASPAWESTSPAWNDGYYYFWNRAAAGERARVGADVPMAVDKTAEEILASKRYAGVGLETYAKNLFTRSAWNNDELQGRVQMGDLPFSLQPSRITTKKTEVGVVSFNKEKMLEGADLKGLEKRLLKAVTLAYARQVGLGDAEAEQVAEKVVVGWGDAAQVIPEDSAIGVALQDDRLAGTFIAVGNPRPREFALRLLPEDSQTATEESMKGEALRRIQTVFAENGWALTVTVNSVAEEKFADPKAERSFAVWIKVDPAQEAATWKRGGIDFNAAGLDMQIKRDGAGMVLPMNQQNLEGIRIDGLVPEILSIQPLRNLPMLSELSAGGGGAA